MIRTGQKVGYRQFRGGDMVERGKVVWKTLTRALLRFQTFEVEVNLNKSGSLNRNRITHGGHVEELDE